jgi:hypothetical protein
MVVNNPVIGRKPVTTPTPSMGAGTVLAPTSASGLPGGLGSAIDKGLGNVGVEPVAGAAVETVNFVIDLTNAEMKRILPYLKKFGATKTDLSTYPNAKKYLQTNFDTLITNANGNLNKLISLFKSEATGYSTEKAKEPTLDQRTISKLNPASIGALIDSVYLSTIGKAASPEQIKQHLAEFEKINTGTVTSYKKVKNPKTGKMEDVATVTPSGFSEEVGKSKLEAQLKESNPLEYQRRKAFEFSNALNQVLSGGI